MCTWVHFVNNLLTNQAGRRSFLVHSEGQRLHLGAHYLVVLRMHPNGTFGCQNGRSRCAPKWYVLQEKSCVFRRQRVWCQIFVWPFTNFCLVVYNFLTSKTHVLGAYGTGALRLNFSTPLSPLSNFFKVVVKFLQPRCQFFFAPYTVLWRIQIGRHRMRPINVFSLQNDSFWLFSVCT